MQGPCCLRSLCPRTAGPGGASVTTLVLPADLPGFQQPASGVRFLGPDWALAEDRPCLLSRAPGAPDSEPPPLTPSAAHPPARRQVPSAVLCVCLPAPTGMSLMDTSPVHPPAPRWREQPVRPHGGSDGPEGGRAAGPPGWAVQGAWVPLIPDPAEQPAVFSTPWGGGLYPGPPSRAGDVRRTPPKHPKPAHQEVLLSKSAFPRHGGGGSRCLMICTTVPPKV